MKQRQITLEWIVNDDFVEEKTVHSIILSNTFIFSEVYDVLGREVAVLVNEVKNAGTYSIQWNALQFSSGLYLAKMTAGSYSSTKKLLLMK